MKIKIFNGHYIDVENDINRWLNKNESKVENLKMYQSSTGNRTTISITYYEISSEIQELLRR